MTNRAAIRSCCVLVPLICALLAASVDARHRSTGRAFVPRSRVSSSTTTTKTTTTTTASQPTALSALDTSAFAAERDAQILAAYASLVSTAAELCRGGYQNDYDYFDDRGYGGSNYNNNNNNNNDDDDYYNDGYGFDDRGPSYDDRGSESNRRSFSMPDIIRTGNRKIGLPMLAIGGALTILGASLFFNKTLMRLGNLFFVAGVPMTLGPGRTAGYFFQPKKARATACLAAGIFLVFVGWPIFGIVLEAFGLLNLFGNMFPMAMMIMKQMPVIGQLLKGNAGGGNNNNNNKRNSRFSDDYDDDDDDRYSGGGGGGGGSRDRYDDYDRYQDDRYDGGDHYNGRGYPDDDDNNNNNRYY
eukprot:CAMPEP_0172385294 /NCGR_PEP_ID=MMETSP1061-20121228/2963_1 /TAXON_ID=37318 /ORGANISM="Pseudo-nitzschia pungens, Strain cf. pungens" /LENGTH=356 /DNA_ID=CAMNT_0013114243 /DNA_START=214 /DNA_END=1284 /DNA_ORIENTATION=+